MLERGVLESGKVVDQYQLESSAEPEANRGETSFWLTRCGEVRDRAEKALEIAKSNNWLLDMGIDNVTLGRTYLLEATLRHKNPVESITSEALTALLQQATHHLNQSISLLRKSGNQDHVPRGLLARAALWRVNSQLIIDNSQLTKEDYLKKANRDLTEVEQIADRSNMLIFQIEAALERCRLALTLGDKAQARTKLHEAKALVKQTERPYEPHIPTWDDWDPPEYIGVFKGGEIVGYHRRNGEITELEKQIG